MKNKGFTLIELMIVVAIIGILAAIAIPAYQDYTCRAKMSEAVNAVTPAKTAVTTYYAIVTEFPAADWDGFSVNLDTKYVQSVLWSGSEISALIKGNSIGCGLSDGDEAIVLSPLTNASRIVDWRCRAGADVPARYLPGTCQ
jgi:type IV pilus assembly protein PilA